MKIRHTLSVYGLFIIFLLSTYSYAAQTPPVPWPSKEVLGELHPLVSETHKEQLIEESLDEKYVPGVSYPAVSVYQHSFTSLNKDGDYVSYYDYAIRVDTPEAKQRIGEQAARFNSEKETLDFLNVVVYLKNGKRIDTDVTTTRIREPFTGLVYSDLKVKTLTVQGLEEGSVVRLIARRTYRPTVDKGYAIAAVDLDNSVPTKEKLTILRFAKGMNITRKERLNPPLPAMTVKEIKLGGDNYYIYRITGIKPRLAEAQSIPASEFDSTIHFFRSATWADVSRLCTGIYEPKMVAGQDVVDKARGLTANLPDREGKIKAVYDYVKAFRYVAISLNEGAFIPRSADETMKNGYGDCKDKSVLTVALLRSIGIDSTVALIRTTRLLDRDVPYPLSFDHAIVAVKGQDGSYAFLDPTSSSAPYGLLPRHDQLRYALILGDKEEEPFLVPPQAPDKNWVNENIEIKLQDAQAAVITNKSDTISPNEWFHLAPKIPREELIRVIKQSMSDKYKEVEIQSLRFDPVNSEGVLKDEITYAIKDFTKRMGNWYVFNPLFDADRLNQSDAISLQTRTTELEIDAPKRLTADVTVRIPDSVTVEFIPKPFSVKSDKFGSYSYEIRQSPGLLHVRRDVQITAKRIPVKDYAEFREFYRACLKQDEEMLGLKSK